MNLQVLPVNSRERLKQFLHLPHRIYRDDPHWVPPLTFERKEFLNPKKNPFFRHGEAQFFLAFKNEKPVGRISAQIHHGHLERFKDATGFFGFFEAMNDKEVAQSLFQTASSWLREKGIKKIRGPFNFTMYDNETGILIDGFDSPPQIMMGHNPPYYASLLEQCGFQKVKDVFAWHYDMAKLSEPAVQIADATRAYPGLTLRSINMKNFAEEVRLMMGIYNEAWGENWGFIPAAEAEIQYVAKQLKPIIDPNMAFFAFVNGDPAGFSVFIPNVNEAIRDLNGKLFPFGWAKLLWRLKRGLKSGRLCLMGIRKPYRGSKLGSLSVLLNVEMHLRSRKGRYQYGELGWTDEANDRINQGISFMGGRKYKTYRIYEKEL
ncbi:MAG: hypothetical protein Q7S68_01220 [Deltaproteobacteria bacterium]|nr:hypothetical protein [Deltaproteobacteria bacterium]